MSNRYDDPVFFEKYGRMARSQDGLAGAGEWHELKKLLPEFTGKRVLDLGCGYGWHCRYAAGQGASSVLGVDGSWRMLQAARERTESPVINYRESDVEELDLPGQSYEVVLSSLMLHYVREYGELCRRIAGWLCPGGVFVFSVEHPVFTAYGNQDWYRDQQGNPLHWPVDRYFEEGWREAVFLGEPVKKYHRTLNGYLEPLWENGLMVTRVVEPMPDPDMLDTVPGMREELRRPMMLLVRAQKQG